MKSLAARDCFLVTRLSEVHIGPASEEVELVPFGLAVTYDDQVHVLVFCHEGIPSLEILATPRTPSSCRTTIHQNG